jgi:hypothetical protein
MYVQVFLSDRYSERLAAQLRHQILLEEYKDASARVM